MTAFSVPADSRAKYTPTPGAFGTANHNAILKACTQRLIDIPQMPFGPGGLRVLGNHAM